MNKKFIKIRAYLMLFILFLIICPKVHSDFGSFSIFGYGLGRDSYDILKFGYFSSYYRAGVGTSLFSSYNPKNDINYNSDQKKDVDMQCVLPLTLYFVPYTWEFEEKVGGIYLYTTFSKWMNNLKSEDESIKIGGLSSFSSPVFYYDIGLGVSLGYFADLKFGRQFISVGAGSYKNNSAIYNIDEYKDGRWNVGLDIYLGYWDEFGSKRSRNEHTYGLASWFKKRKGAGKVSTKVIEVGRVDVNVANIRSGASTKFSIVAKAGPKDRLEILEKKDKWARIKLPDGKVGWIYKPLLVESKLVRVKDKRKSKELVSEKKKESSLDLRPIGPETSLLNIPKPTGDEMMLYKEIEKELKKEEGEGTGKEDVQEKVLLKIAKEYNLTYKQIYNVYIKVEGWNWMKK